MGSVIHFFCLMIFLPSHWFPWKPGLHRHAPMESSQLPLPEHVSSPGHTNSKQINKLLIRKLGEIFHLRFLRSM